MYKAAALLAVYAVLMIVMGVLTYQLAPEGAKAFTALAIPGVAGLMVLACAVLCVIGSRRPRNTDTAEEDEKRHNASKAAMIGVHAGLVLPLLFAVAFGFRAFGTTTAIADARQVLGDADATVTDQIATAVTAGPEALEEARDTIGKDYLATSLWGLTALSVMAFGGVVLLRPKPAKAD